MSLRYPQLLCVFEHFSRNFRALTPCRTIERARHRLARVNEAATPRRILLRSGTRSDGAVIFMISKLRPQIAQLVVRVR